MFKNFHAALSMSKEILKNQSNQISQERVDAEAEQLFLAVYRQFIGSSLSRIQLFSQMQNPFPEQAWIHLARLSEQRAQGKILQHLTGVQVFGDHEYKVGPEVLVPRPETEVLLEKTISELSLSKKGPFLGLEIGVGSGVLSIELLCRFPSLRMIASELSSVARARALSNAEKILGVESLKKGCLTLLSVNHPQEVFHPFEREQGPLRGDFLISNPPYLDIEDSIESDVLLYEPAEALFAPKGDPLYFYRVMADQARKYLNSNGQVFVEVPHERASLIGQLFEKKGWDVRIYQDLTGRERVLIAQ